MEYFEDKTVPVISTVKVGYVIPLIVRKWILRLLFIRAKELKERGLEARNFQTINIRSKGLSNGKVKYSVEIQQVLPNDTSYYEIELSNVKKYNGRICIIERYNPKEKNLSVFNHCIVMFLQHEHLEGITV